MIFVLQENTTLEVLALYENNIGDEGGKAIAKALEVSPICLSFVSFSCAVTPTPVTTYHTQDNKTLLVIPVAKLRGDDEKCTELDLKSKGYKNEDAVVIAALLAVRVLLFFSYPPPGNHAHFCVCATQKNTSITKLDLSENEIGDEGGKAIGKALEVSLVSCHLFRFPVRLPPSR